jgi:hypothetical protein
MADYMVWHPDQNGIDLLMFFREKLVKEFVQNQESMIHPDDVLECIFRKDMRESIVAIEAEPCFRLTSKENPIRGEKLSFCFKVKCLTETELKNFFTHYCNVDSSGNISRSFSFHSVRELNDLFFNAPILIEILKQLCITELAIRRILDY